MNKNELFNALYNAFIKAYPEKKKSVCQTDAVMFWNQAKSTECGEQLEALVRNKIQELEAFAMNRKGKLLQFWGKAASKPSQPLVHATEPPKNKQSSVEISPQPSTSGCTKRPAHAQEKLKNELSEVTEQVLRLKERDSAGLITDEELTKLRGMTTKKAKLEKDLKTKISEQERQQKHRDQVKSSKQRLIEAIPEAANFITARTTIGRPRLEEQQSELLKSICDIALHGSAAQEKRQFESARSVKTLDELTTALHEKGFHLSRSATYLRLLPRRINSSEGKRHVKTVPVKLLRASNAKHNDHQDGRFCTATIRCLEQIASLVGPDEVAFISQDDKARVVIGLTAANKQAPMLMHVEYRITLPDHDWIVAQRHKLIPSVTAGIEIKRNGLGQAEAVGYSGPTYIAIRSGKHSSSTAYSHAVDFKRLLELEEFDSIMKVDGLVKPIVIIIVDGGPDENPRYRKVIQVAIHHFLEHNLDALFIATNAPGRSAFNRVERRMAPLSKELAGLIIPHDHFGSHLDSQLRTTDEDLEKKNFKFAGETLAAVWGDLLIDDFPTIAEYVDPESSEVEPDSLECRDQRWFDIHVRTSQYCLQIVKCDDRTCCTSLRSSLETVLPRRFLPPPVSLVQSSEGLRGASRDQVQCFPSVFVLNSIDTQRILPKAIAGFKILPHDLYCPSLKNTLKDRVCAICGLYFASQVMLNSHKKVHNASKTVKKILPKRVAARRHQEVLVLQNGADELEWMDEKEVDLKETVCETQDIPETYPIVAIGDYLQCPWIEQ